MYVSVLNVFVPSQSACEVNVMLMYTKTNDLDLFHCNFLQILIKLIDLTSSVLFLHFYVPITVMDVE